MPTANGSIGLPPLNLSTGPSMSSGTSTANGTSTTGEFIFKGSSNASGGWQGALQSLVPVLGMGVVAWLILRR